MVSIDTAVLGAATHQQVKEARQEQQQRHRTEIESDILSWLSSFDYGAPQSDFLSAKQAGTGLWLLESQEFQDWSSGSKGILFCPGIPGQERQC